MERRVYLIQSIILSYAFLKVSLKPYLVDIYKKKMRNAAFRLAMPVQQSNYYFSLS